MFRIDDLTLSANTSASPEQTVDEFIDAYVFSKSKNAEVHHANTMNALQSQRRQEDIVNTAKQLTQEACERDRGSKPGISEARKMEHPQTQAPDNTPSATASQIDDEGEAAYLRMMQTVFAAANAKGDENV